jgi:hypothetical protein
MLRVKHKLIACFQQIPKHRTQPTAAETIPTEARDRSEDTCATSTFTIRYVAGRVHLPVAEKRSTVLTKPITTQSLSGRLFTTPSMLHIHVFMPLLHQVVSFLRVRIFHTLPFEKLLSSSLPLDSIEHGSHDNTQSKEARRSNSMAIQYAG